MLLLLTHFTVSASEGSWAAALVLGHRRQPLAALFARAGAGGTEGSGCQHTDQQGNCS